jgi:predicted RNase H-like HicB family nuclease
LAAPLITRLAKRIGREVRIEPMKYLVEVFWSDDDEGYIAIVPDLPGCSAFGETPKAAVHQIGDATLAWIAARRASGDPIPEPTTKARQAPRPPCRRFRSAARKGS